MIMDNFVSNFFSQLTQARPVESLFDVIEDTVYFVKDSDSRYVAVNLPLVRRCGFSSKDELIGKTAEEVFPPHLGERFTAQDKNVLMSGEPVRGELELHFFSAGNESWCLTWKEPVRGEEGKIVGLVGISRDINFQAVNDPEIQAIASTLKLVQETLDQPMTTEDLAARGGFSAYQLDRRMKELFGITTAQYITRCRINLACHRLSQTAEPISQIAIACGYSEQSSFTRQFGRSVGITPKAYRDASTRVAGS